MAASFTETEVLAPSNPRSSRVVPGCGGVPVAPVRLAQANRNRLTLVLDRDDQPRFFLRIASSAMQDADGFVGTFRNDYDGARFDVDGLPRLIQFEAQRFLHDGLPSRRRYQILSGPAGEE